MPHLSAAISADGLLFLSGQIAFDASGEVIGGVEEQTLRCLDLLEASLMEHGLGRDAIVRTGVWLTERSHFAPFDRSYARFFGEHRPARTTVISALAIDGALVEIDAVAIAVAR